jgi:hypothetical protein
MVFLGSPCLTQESSTVSSNEGGNWLLGVSWAQNIAITVCPRPPGVIFEAKGKIWWSSGLLFLFPTSPHEILCISMNIQENGLYRSYGRVQSMHVHCQLAYHKILLRASTYKYLRMEIICKFNACVAHEPGLNKAQLPPTVHPGMHNFVIKEQSMWASKIRHFKYRPWLRMHN